MLNAVVAAAAAATLLLASPPDDGGSAAREVAGEWTVRWDRSSAGLRPPIFEGVMHVDDDGEQASLKWRHTRASFSVKTLSLIGDRLDATFTVPGRSDVIEFTAHVTGDTMIGRMRAIGTAPWTAFEARRPRALRAGSAGDPTFQSIEATDAGLDPAAVDALIARAGAEHSSALVVVKDRRTVVEAYALGSEGVVVNALAMSKSVVSLAVGILVADGKLSLDTKLGDVFTEWRDADDPAKAKSAITIRQMLSHTSGLATERAASDEVWRIRRRVETTPVVWEPGTRFADNNNAVDILGVVVARVADKPLDAFMEERLFDKLGIAGAKWMKDREGTPRAAAELLIRPVDVAKLGQLMLDDGVWEGERILPAGWVAQSIAASQGFDESCGLLWWREGSFSYGADDALLLAWRDAGVDDAGVSAVRALSPAPSRDAWMSAVRRAVNDKSWRALSAAVDADPQFRVHAVRETGPQRGFSARGALGQFLVVLPAERVVAVRMRAKSVGDVGRRHVDTPDRDFPDRVRALVEGRLAAR